MTCVVQTSHAASAVHLNDRRGHINTRSLLRCLPPVSSQGCEPHVHFCPRSRLATHRYIGQQTSCSSCSPAHFGRVVTACVSSPMFLRRPRVQARRPFTSATSIEKLATVSPSRHVCARYVLQRACHAPPPGTRADGR